MDRGTLLQLAALAPAPGVMPSIALGQDAAAQEKADYTLRIASGLVELAPDHIASTTLYNDQFPGPLMPEPAP